MVSVLKNTRRGAGKLALTAPYPSTDVARVSALLAQCPSASPTPLVDASDLGPVAALWVKDERTRMNLGSFKALGAAYVIACDAVKVEGATPGRTALTGKTYVTASAGNHGMSVAAGARVFGANSVVYIAETVPESFAARLRAQGAKVVREGADYAGSMVAAEQAAAEEGWTLLSDSSWENYTDIPHLLMEGYLQMADEAIEQCPDTPTHIMLQAGVGGLAGAVAALVRARWGNQPKIVVVEPEAAPALQKSVEAGHSVFADGPDSIMGRLDCKEPSLIALNGLARDADAFLTISDEEVTSVLPEMAEAGLDTTASGGAGVAVVLSADARQQLGIDSTSRVLCFLSETSE